MAAPQAQSQLEKVRSVCELRVPLPKGKGAIPCFGLGCWMADKSKLASFVRDAIVEHGVRHIDTASEYNVRG